MQKRERRKAIGDFSMSSMTDIIFLLLIFFMITSTMVVPNAIKVLLPQSNEQSASKPQARIIIDKDLKYHAVFGNEEMRPITLEQVEPFLKECAAKNPEMHVALYADGSIPYDEVVKILNIANENKYKMVLATRPLDKK